MTVTQCTFHLDPASNADGWSFQPGVTYLVLQDWLLVNPISFSSMLFSGPGDNKSGFCFRAHDRLKSELYPIVLTHQCNCQDSGGSIFFCS